MDGWTERPWGRWRTLYRDEHYELRLLEIKAGGHCSWHWHNSKDNQFQVVSGLLAVDVGVDLAPKVHSRHVLSPRSATVTVPTCRAHRFVAISDSVVYESTMALDKMFEPLDCEEINRLTEGGMMDHPEEIL